MSSRLAFTPVSPSRKYENAQGTRWRPTGAQAKPHERNPDNVLVYRFSPTGTSGNIDPAGGTSSGVTIISGDRLLSAEVISAAYMFLLTAGRKAGTTAAIVDNLITVTINSVEIGRIYVDGTNEKFGQFYFDLPDDRSDSRVNLAGGGSTARFNFAFTAADPSLEVYLEVAGDY